MAYNIDKRKLEHDRKTALGRLTGLTGQQGTAFSYAFDKGYRNAFRDFLNNVAHMNDSRHGDGSVKDMGYHAGYDAGIAVVANMASHGVKSTPNGLYRRADRNDARLARSQYSAYSRLGLL